MFFTGPVTISNPFVLKGQGATVSSPTNTAAASGSSSTDYTHFLATGLFWGFIGLVLLALLTVLNVLFRAAEEKDAMGIFLQVIAGLALVFVCAAGGLASAWTRDNAESVVLYLGIPDWKSNIFAWHVTLAVCGFFFSQVFSSLFYYCTCRFYFIFFLYSHL